MLVTVNSVSNIAQSAANNTHLAERGGGGVRVRFVVFGSVDEVFLTERFESFICFSAKI